MSKQKKIDKYTLIGNFGQLVSATQEYILDFKKITKNSDLLEEFKSIPRVYANMIIVNLSQILSCTKGDELWLELLKEYFPGEISDKIIWIEKQFEIHKDWDLFKRVYKSRNQRSAHLANTIMPNVDERLYDYSVLLRNIDIIENALTEINKLIRDITINHLNS